jgi:hypothetical protein
MSAASRLSHQEVSAHLKFFAGPGAPSLRGRTFRSDINRQHPDCHPDRSRPPFLAHGSFVRGLRSGGIVAILQRNSVRCDPTSRVKRREHEKPALPFAAAPSLRVASCEGGSWPSAPEQSFSQSLPHRAPTDSAQPQCATPVAQVRILDLSFKNPHYNPPRRAPIHSRHT